MSQVDKQNSPRRRPLRDFLEFMALEIGGLLVVGTWMAVVPSPWNMLSIPFGLLLGLLVLVLIYWPRKPSE